MGYLNHLVEFEKAGSFVVRSELPSLSRPLYEVLLTGTPSHVNGISSNGISRRSTQKSVFHLAKDSGLRTAAAAYHWVSELYNFAPFDPIMHRRQDNAQSAIQAGRFYFSDDYPDSHLFADAEDVRKTWDPHFLYIHPMGMDYVGHQHGSDSKEYRGKAIEIDSILARLLPTWMSEGYKILITSDHGMNRDGQHGGTGDDVRLVSLYLIGDSSMMKYLKSLPQPIPQLLMAPMMCRLLSISPSNEMLDF